MAAASRAANDLPTNLDRPSSRGAPREGAAAATKEATTETHLIREETTKVVTLTSPERVAVARPTSRAIATATRILREDTRAAAIITLRGEMRAGKTPTSGDSRWIQGLEAAVSTLKARD